MKGKKYFPYEYCSSAYDIDYEKLRRLGYRAILFDIDNTLVPHNADADERVEALFTRLRGLGFQIALLTDNGAERTARFNQRLGAACICLAGKPDPAPYHRAAAMLGVQEQETVVIGDQMFRDILGAGNAAMASILVKYVDRGGRWLGWRRYLEYLMLFFWRFSGDYHRMGGISMSEKTSYFKNIRLFLKRELLFCNISPLCFKISNYKEILKRHIANLLHRTRYPKEKSSQPLSCAAYRYQAGLIKRGKDIDPATQYAKAENIAIACRKINGILLKPGEEFSFWRSVGPTTARRGYQAGRVIERGTLVTGIGGGLCNLGNTIHLLALHSPLTVTEVHYHSDALAPDHGERVPMSAGTSVRYNYIDLRLRNDTEQTFQFLAEVKDETLFAELRCEQELPFSYAVTEENHRFVQENGKFYRMSRIYRDTLEKDSGKLIRHELIRDNRSEVMFDPALIPQALLQR